MTEENKNERIMLMFSKKAANSLGSSFAGIPDGHGGRKEMEYTNAYDPDKYNGRSYKWDDKEVVWVGAKSEYKWLFDRHRPSG